MTLDESTPIEARVLAHLICEPDVLGRLIERDVDPMTSDFAHYPHRAVFEAFRNLEAKGSAISLTAVASYIAARDVEREEHVSDTVTPLFLANLVGGTHAYETDDGIAEDLCTLRVVARERAA